MIEPTKDDVGRTVLYRNGTGELEEGVITSVRPAIVFVRYKSQHPSADGQATDCADLSWAHA